MRRVRRAPSFSCDDRTVCVGADKSEHCREFKEMNFHFAHRSSNPTCPATQSLSAKSWTDGFAEGSMRPPPRRIVGSSWWDRACCARSPFRKETYHVSITDADDRRHDFVGVGGWYASHLHR